MSYAIFRDEKPCTGSGGGGGDSEKTTFFKREREEAKRRENAAAYRENSENPNETIRENCRLTSMGKRTPK